MNPSVPRRDLANLVFGVLAIGLLMVATLWILKAFLLSFVWATMIVVATWPMLIGAQKRLRNSRAAAVAVLTIGMLMILIVPLVLGTTAILENAGKVKDWVQELAQGGIPDMPQWIGKLPVVGKTAGEKWAAVQAAGAEGLAAQFAKYAQPFLAWLASKAGGMGMIVVHLFLTLILTVVLYFTGETAAAGVKRFFRRLAGEHGEEMVDLAGKAIRAVAIGIVVTALIQSALGGIGLLIAGVPGAAVLTAVMFILSIAQLGPFPVLLVAAAWLFWKGLTVWGIALVVWTLVVGTIDNLIRPILIRRGADLPLLLIFAGVLGGLMAFGVVGLFVGPVVLAVSYTLLDAWIREGDEASPDQAA